MINNRYVLFVALIALVGAAMRMPVVTAAGGTTAQENPFFAESTLPFKTPPFDKISDDDYEPAFDEGMKRNTAEIDAIAESSEAPTFDNTIVAMERAGSLLDRVSKVFFNLTQTDTNPTMQKIQAEVAPKLAAHRDSIFLNPKLFARVKAIYDKRDSLGSTQSRST